MQNTIQQIEKRFGDLPKHAELTFCEAPHKKLSNNTALNPAGRIVYVNPNEMVKVCKP